MRRISAPFSQIGDIRQDTGGVEQGGGLLERRGGEISLI